MELINWTSLRVGEFYSQFGDMSLVAKNFMGIQSSRMYADGIMRLVVPSRILEGRPD